VKLRNPAIVAIAWVIELAAPGHTADSPVKIEVQIPLTGERSAVGRLIGNGLQMAVDALNSRTGSAKVELIFADDASTPEGSQVNQRTGQRSENRLHYWRNQQSAGIGKRASDRCREDSLSDCGNKPPDYGLL
jgi:hypothetical protein